MKAMIFAAGLGTRLRPITDTVPKALVPVGGVPMLERVITKVRDAGISGIVVNAHHFSEKIEDFLRNNDFGVKVDVSVEQPEPLETGGGIKRAEKFLKGDRFLVSKMQRSSLLCLTMLSRQSGLLTLHKS